MADLVETMFYVGAVPWHKKGKGVGEAPNTKEAVILSGLDWEAEALPIYTPAFIPTTMTNPLDGSLITGTGRVADLEGRALQLGEDIERVPIGQVVRRMTDGKMLGVVGPRWVPYQNRDAFAWFDPLVESGLARLHTAGSLRGGRTVWILAQIGNELPVVGSDTVGQFLLLTHGHDGTRGIRVQPTPIRVVCANTLSGAVDDKLSFMTPHTRGAGKRLDDLREFVEPYLANFERAVGVFRELAAKPLGTVMVQEFLNDLFPATAKTEDGERAGGVAWGKKARAEVEALFAGMQIGDDAMPAPARRSRWAMYSAVSEYVDHTRGRNDDTRLYNAWFGDGAKMKARAYALLSK